MKVILLCLIISFVVSIVGGIIEPSHPTQHGEASFGGYWFGAICAVCSIIYSVLSYTIVLNLYKTIRDNIYLCFLSFFSPVIVILICVLITDGIKVFFLTLFFSIPFIIVQTFYFVKFRKRLSTGEILEGFYIDSYSDEDN